MDEMVENRDMGEKDEMDDRDETNGFVCDLKMYECSSLGLSCSIFQIVDV